MSELGRRIEKSRPGPADGGTPGGAAAAPSAESKIRRLADPPFTCLDNYCPKEYYGVRSREPVFTPALETSRRLAEFP
jgi:hypothetical protein